MCEGTRGTRLAALQQSRDRRYEARCRRTPHFLKLRRSISKALSPGCGIALPNDAPHPFDPTAIHIAAQDRAVTSGGKLVPEELAKREKNPFDMWDEMNANAAAGRFPMGLDADSGGSRPRIRDDVAHHSGMMSLG